MLKGLLSLLGAWMIPILAVVTVALGTWGWLDFGYPGHEAAYRGVLLFDFGAGVYEDPPGSTDWRFLVGRWTGLAAIFGAALLALGILLQERLALALARWARQEVVVIGEEAISVKAFEAAREARTSVLWLGSSDVGAESIRTLALPWPPDERTRTVRERGRNAEYVLIAEPDDAQALVLYHSAREAAPNALITILMHDIHLAEAAAAAINEPRTRVLSMAASAARTLNSEHPPFLIARDKGHPRIHAVIIGFGQTGQAVARDLIVNCRTTYLEMPMITVIDPLASALEGVMRVQAPELDECAKINFIDGKVDSRGIAPGAEQLGVKIRSSGQVTCVYICLHRDDEALGAASMIQSLLRTADMAQPPVFVRLHDGAAVLTTTNDTHGLNSLIPFGDLDTILAASEFLSKEPDKAAREFCEAYRASLTPEMRDDPNNRSARPWDQLAETFRQANRDAVAHIPAKMASAGIDPAVWRGVSGLPKPPEGTRLFNNPKELEKLAILEHHRWNAQRRMDGWRHTSTRQKDEARRLHPSLVPYHSLSDDVKEYDRVYIRQTQRICWGVD